jgi:hypothetical protein
MFENHSTSIVNCLIKKHVSRKNTHLLEPFFQQEASIEHNLRLILQSDDTIKYSSRLNHKYLVFHSLEYRKNNENKSCSYIIRYHKTKQLFGYIDYFFEIGDNLYACINQIITTENTFIKQSPLNYHNCFYLITSIDQNFKIILCSDIINKCIKIKINETVSFITDFISENEHD